MMRYRAPLMVAILLLAPLAGCIAPGDGEDTEMGIEWTQEPPSNTTAGEPVQVAWRLTGPDGTAARTEVHWGSESIDDPQSDEPYGNTTGGVDDAEVPGEYSANLTFDGSGTYYVRAHVLVEEDGDSVWTDEVEVEVENGSIVDGPLAVQLGEVPDEVAAGENFTVNWTLAGVPGNVDTTGVYFGPESHPNASTPSDYEESAGIEQQATVPGQFNASVSWDQNGTLYLRAHALQDGQHYWSEEVAINVTGNASGNETGNQTTVTVSITSATLPVVGSPAFDPSEITVAPGDVVQFVNEDDAEHTVSWENETLEGSPAIEPGGAWNFTVPQELAPGDYEFFLEESTDVTGTMTVEASP